MTIHDFYKEHCSMCGSIRCPRDEEAISTCGYYEGDIQGIEKKESIHDILNKAISKDSTPVENIDTIVEKLNEMDVERVDIYIHLLINIYNSVVSNVFETTAVFKSIEKFGNNIKVIFEDGKFIILPKSGFFALVNKNYTLPECQRYVKQFAENLEKLLKGKNS